MLKIKKMFFFFFFTGRYEDDFINERMKQLQYWMDRMVRHPVISHCDTFNHFLTCTDEKVIKLIHVSFALQHLL